MSNASAPDSATGAAIDDQAKAPVRRGGRRAESRRRLLDAARELFVSRGYHATRPQDITKAANLGHGTFYIHFKDKRECFLAFVDEAQQELMASIEKATAEINADDSDAVSLKKTFMGIVDHATKHPGVLAAVMSDPAIIAAEEAPEETIVDQWAQNWAEGFAEQAKAGLVRNDIDPALLGMLMVGAMQSTLIYLARGTAPAEQAIDQLVSFVISALAPQK